MVVLNYRVVRTTQVQVKVAKKVKENVGKVVRAKCDSCTRQSNSAVMVSRAEGRNEQQSTGC